MPPADVRISWQPTPPSLAQTTAWQALWQRLLARTAPEARMPQEFSSGAPETVTAANGHNIIKRLDSNDSTSRATRH